MVAILQQNRPQELARRSEREESEVYRAVTGMPGTGSAGAIMIRALTDWRLAIRALRYAMHLPTPLQTEDRRVLERVILPEFARRLDVKTVLFVGCQWYTRHYSRAFRRQTYWTIDPLEGSRRYAGARHVVAPLELLSEHFTPGSFDLILCNGVYGFGLDSRAQCEIAFENCYACLRPGGYLVLGWTDVPARTPVPLESIQSLSRFERMTFEPLKAWRYQTDTSYRHTYDFYVR